jgi:hypothetical protein
VNCIALSAHIPKVLLDPCLLSDAVLGGEYSGLFGLFLRGSLNEPFQRYNMDLTREVESTSVTSGLINPQKQNAIRSSGFAPESSLCCPALLPAPSKKPWAHVYFSSSHLYFRTNFYVSELSFWKEKTPSKLSPFWLCFRDLVLLRKQSGMVVDYEIDFFMNALVFETIAGKWRSC